MNRQPYGIPPRWWPPKLSPWWVRATRGYRSRQLRSGQRITRIDVAEETHLQRALAAGCGVLIAPNHSAHFDSAALYLAADRMDQPLYFMTAWQVFAMSSRWEQWALQRLGCFSIDRESADRKAYKQAVDILQKAAHPLVVFPEGDIYHVSDRITAFREGAAAIALTAARRASRPIVVIPCGIKFWYVDDPTVELTRLMEQLEIRLLLRPQPEWKLPERIHRFAQAVLALKELDYLGMTQTGRVRDRIGHLAEAVLSELETRHQLPKGGRSVPERVKELRQKVISELNKHEAQPHNNQPPVTRLLQDMEDLFFVMQLFSYPGDYLLNQPTVERLAETLDKFEEDVLERDYPSVRGRRRASIRFGEPIPVNGTGKRDQVAELSRHMQDRVQGLLDTLNHPSQE